MDDHGKRLWKLQRNVKMVSKEKNACANRCRDDQHIGGTGISERHAI